MIASIEGLFDSIDARRAQILASVATIDTYFDKRTTLVESTAVECLHQARDTLLNRLKIDQDWVSAKKQASQLAKFTLSSLDVEESRLFNYDVINPRSNFPNLFNLVKFIELYRLRLNEISFVEPNFQFSANFISVLAVGKIFMDMNCFREEEEHVICKRKLVIINSRGRKLYELDYRPIGEEYETNTLPYVAKNRIFIFFCDESQPDKYQVDVFNFKLELQKTVSLSKDIRHLVQNQNELCIQTTTNLRFYDLDLNYQNCVGQKDNSNRDFFLSNLRIISLNDSILCFYSFNQVQIVFMSRRTGEVLSRASMNFPVFDSLSLYDLGNEQIFFLSKFFRNTPKQKTTVLSTNGSVLIEKEIDFFVSEVTQSPYGTIILNRGFFYNNQENMETIRFKTF